MSKIQLLSTFCSDALGSLDGVALAEKIKKGEISSLDVVKAAIARAQLINPHINAIATDTFDLAIRQAEKIVSGGFAGVPVFVKDNEDFSGAPTLYGSRSVIGVKKRKSAVFIRQYLSTGLVCIGKSTTPEFGLAITTESLLHGPTRNPWNCNYSTGGSSGGSAALVAAGVVPIAHGNDGGGSIRIPAACCGLVGLKPTRGRLKMDPKYNLLLVKIICPGVLTRTVRDTATFYAEAEKYYCNEKLPKIGLVDRPSKKRLSIGIITDGPHNTSCHPELRNLTLKTGALCEKLGHTVKEMKYPFNADIIDELLIYWGMIAFSFCSFGKLTIGSSLNCKCFESWTSGLNKLFKKNIARIPGIIMRLRGFEETYNSAFRNCDILLSPTLSNPTPELGYLGPQVPFNDAFERVKKYVAFTLQQNISGAPAISLPMGMDSNGLPMGIQFASTSGREKMLLELALELEEANPWPLATGLSKSLF